MALYEQKPPFSFLHLPHALSSLLTSTTKPSFQPNLTFRKEGYLTEKGDRREMAQATMAKGLEPRICTSGSNLSRSRAHTVPITSSLRLAGVFNSSSLRCRNGGFASSRHVVVRASVAAAPGKPSTVPEIVLQPIKEISGTINLPGSKSLSNRTLLLAALSEVSYLVSD